MRQTDRQADRQRGGPGQNGTGLGAGRLNGQMAEALENWQGDV